MSRYRYGAWNDGPDPLAPPFDGAAAVDGLAERIIEGQSVREALRDLMREGVNGQRGLDELRRQARKRRRQLEKSGRLDGTLSDIRDLLDQALELERAALFPDPSDDARFRESMLDMVADDTARAVRELRDYDWRSPEAREAFEQINERLRRDVLDSQFRDISKALEGADDPTAAAALKDMLADLNQLMAKHRRGDDVTDDFSEFMNKHGEFFPDNPESFEELLDELARRAAATQRMLDSLTPEQRQQLGELMDQAFSDLDLAAQMAELGDNLRALRPDLAWNGAVRMDGEQGLPMPDATSAIAELADLEALEQQLGQGYAGASLDDVDEEAVRRALGRRAVDDLEQLRAIERELERQGFLTQGGERVELSAKAVRRIGRMALKQVFGNLQPLGRGNHDVASTGVQGDLTGTTRQWQFGDEEPIDVVRTLGNAVTRHLSEGGSTDGRIALTPDDFEISETETRTRAAVVLLVDQSFSMVVNDTWRAAKITALALHSLVTTTFPLDAIEVIAFANLARVIAPHELPNLEASTIQGTNLQHALMLASRFLDRHHDAEPVLLVVTDGEPTAHLDREGQWWFDWPPAPETLTLTIAEIDRLTQHGVPISWFQLGDDPRLEEFLDQMAKRNGGRVLAATGDRLGNYVVSDYLRQRSGRRRRA